MTTWRTADGELVEIQDMETPHLLNAMSLLYKKALQCLPNGSEEGVDNYLPPIYHVMEAAFLERRRPARKPAVRKPRRAARKK